MQTHALNNVLDHLQVSFAFDKDETRKMLMMLHKALTESTPILLSGNAERIYDKSHKLHSELHICGYDDLADAAAAIESLAKKGIADEALIKDFLYRSSAFAHEIEDWLKR